MTQAIALRLLLLVMLITVGVSQAQVVCFDCFANSTSAGQFCSIDRLCTGASCYFNVDPSGTWSAGCSSQTHQPAIDCVVQGNDGTNCGCSGDFCNKFEIVNHTLHNAWPSRAPFSTLQLAWPQDPMITCQECGNLTIGGLVRDIPCDEQHLCMGNYCATKRGQTPHSYCGSSWQGTSAVACFKNPGEDEQCVCPQQMCNAVLPTEKTTSPKTTIGPTTLGAILTSATVPPTPGQDPSPTTTTTPVVKRCKSNIKFSPNAQAVSMGEKLKNIIMGGFPSGSDALQNFQDDIDTHICVYSD